MAVQPDQVVEKAMEPLTVELDFICMGCGYTRSIFVDCPVTAGLVAMFIRRISVCECGCTDIVLTGAREINE